MIMLMRGSMKNTCIYIFNQKIMMLFYFLQDRLHWAGCEGRGGCSDSGTRGNLRRPSLLPRCLLCGHGNSDAGPATGSVVLSYFFLVIYYMYFNLLENLQIPIQAGLSHIRCLLYLRITRLIFPSFCSIRYINIYGIHGISTFRL